MSRSSIGVSQIGPARAAGPPRPSEEHKYSTRKLVRKISKNEYWLQQVDNTCAICCAFCGCRWPIRVARMGSPKEFTFIGEEYDLCQHGEVLEVRTGGHLPAGGCAEGCCPRPARPPPAALHLADMEAELAEPALRCCLLLPHQPDAA